MDKSNEQLHADLQGAFAELDVARDDFRAPKSREELLEAHARLKKAQAQLEVAVEEFVNRFSFPRKD